MLLTIVIISVILFISIGINIYFFRLLNKLINQADEYDAYINNLEDYINNIEKDIKQTYTQLKIIDDRQLFMKDDDVGFVFSDIVNLIEKLKRKYDQISKK